MPGPGGNNMSNHTQESIDKLSKDPVSYAMLMDEDQIEHVIVGFVSVLIQIKFDRGGKN
jgi:hypothetical protein